MEQEWLFYIHSDEYRQLWEELGDLTDRTGIDYAIKKAFLAGCKRGQKCT